jgi:hypothetical protein
LPAAGVALLFFVLGTGVLAHGQSAAPTGELATVTYRRVFEGSTPEFVEISVREDGSASADVRQLSDAAAPETFEVRPELSVRIFELARAARNFQGADFDIHRRVAYLGQKTFRWQKGAESYQTQYNYTIDSNASKLQAVFEGLTQQQVDLATLEQKLRYDRLGVNEALQHFENNVNRQVLPEPERFLPVLDRIAEDPRLLDIARQRARTLAARIRTAQTR